MYCPILHSPTTPIQYYLCKNVDILTYPVQTYPTPQSIPSTVPYYTKAVLAIEYRHTDICRADVHLLIVDKQLKLNKNKAT